MSEKTRREIIATALHREATVECRGASLKCLLKGLCLHETTLVEDVKDGPQLDALRRLFEVGAMARGVEKALDAQFPMEDYAHADVVFPVTDAEIAEEIRRIVQKSILPVYRKLPGADIASGSAALKKWAPARKSGIYDATSIPAAPFYDSTNARTHTKSADATSVVSESDLCTLRHAAKSIQQHVIRAIERSDVELIAFERRGGLASGI
jgi:hypothetical protein